MFLVSSLSIWFQAFSLHSSLCVFASSIFARCQLSWQMLVMDGHTGCILFCSKRVVGCCSSYIPVFQRHFIPFLFPWFLWRGQGLHQLFVPGICILPLFYVLLPFLLPLLWFSSYSSWNLALHSLCWVPRSPFGDLPLVHLKILCHLRTWSC